MLLALKIAIVGIMQYICKAAIVVEQIELCLREVCPWDYLVERIINVLLSYNTDCLLLLSCEFS